MKQIGFLLFAILSVVFSSNSLMAQGGGRSVTVLAPPPPPNRPVDAINNQTPSDVPFDGGLSLIAIAGVAYAAKKGHDKRKQQKKA